MKPPRFLLLAIACCTSAFAVTDPATLEAARTLFKTTGKSAEAQAAFEKIAANDPKNAEVQRGLAELALRRGDTDKAIAYAEKAVALAPDSDDCQTTLGDAAGSAAQKASIFRQLGLASPVTDAKAQTLIAELRPWEGWALAHAAPPLPA